MAFAPLVLGGLSAITSLFNKPKPAVQTNTSTTNSNQNQQFNNSSTPMLSDNQQRLADLFSNGAINRYLKGPQDLTGFAANGLKQINAGADAKHTLLKSSLASRGLAYSPYASTLENAGEGQRIGDQVNFSDQLPLLQRSLEGEDLAGLMKAFSTQPTGTQSSGTAASTGTSTTDQHGTALAGQNSPWANALTDFGSALALPQAGGSNLQAILKRLGLG